MSQNYNMNDIYKPKDFAKEIGVAVITLQRWDNAGILTAYRSPTGRRYYTSEQLKNYKEGKYNKSLKEEEIPGFGEWVLSKYEKDNEKFPFEYFVKDIEDDINFPINEKNAEKIFDYLIKENACDEFLMSFTMAFKEYKKEFNGK